MKIRTDFVTNSSSSSFVLARKGELTEKQKNALVNYIIKNFLGEKILEPGASEEEFKEAYKEYYYYDIEEDDEDNGELNAARQALADGKSIYAGWVNFEGAGNDYADIFEDIWRILSSDSENFEIINGDLSY